SANGNFSLRLGGSSGDRWWVAITSRKCGTRRTPRSTSARSRVPETFNNQISSPRLRNLLNDLLYRLFGRAEDPPPDCIIEEIPIFGGSYRVFPGAGESFPFILRNMIAAIFFSSHITNKQFLQDSHDSAAAILSISNEVAVRAGLRRGTEPS